MTKGLLCSARHKQYLSLKCKKNPDNVELNSYFKKYKNSFTKLIKHAKINYYTEKFSSVSSNLKLTWKLVNELTSRNSKNKDSIDFININDQSLNVEDNTEEAANHFNKFFVNVTENLAGNFNKFPKVQITHNKTCLYSFDDIFLKEIEASEVRKIIRNYKDDTAAGYDQVTVKILKNISELIITPLVFIYNLSVKESIFPDDFKIAIVKPLFKRGDRRYMSNYRPISLLTNFSKIFEKNN
jgi:Notch-like protein